MWLIWVLISALMIYLLYVLLVKEFWKPGKDQSALDILKRRYVRGEISRKEFKKYMSEIKH